MFFIKPQICTDKHGWLHNASFLIRAYLCPSVANILKDFVRHSLTYKHFFKKARSFGDFT